MNNEEIAKERREVRRSITESLRLIIQSQYVLADLQVNQRRLEQLLAALSDEYDLEEPNDPAEAADEAREERRSPAVDEHSSDRS